MTARRDPEVAPRRSPAARVGGWLLKLLLALVLVLCAALAAAFSLEQFTLKPLAELLVEKITGRTLSIEGGLDLRAGRIVSLRVGGIRLANADWGSSDDMLSIGEVEVFVDPTRFIDGVPVVESLNVSSAKLLFEQDEQGRSNWAMGSGDHRSPSASAAENHGPPLIPIIRSQLAGGVMSLRQLEFSTPRGHLAGQLSVSIRNPRQFGQFDLNAKGDKFDEFFPSTSAFRPAAVAFDLDAPGSWNSNRFSIEQGVLQLADGRIEVQGEIDLPPDTMATRLVLSAHGDSLADLGQIRGLTLPPEEYRVDATPRGKADNLEISGVDVRLGDSDLLGALNMDFAEKPDIRIDLDSDFFDLAQL